LKKSTLLELKTVISFFNFYALLSKKKEKKQEFFAKGKQAGSISFKFIAVWKFEMFLISFD